MAARALCSRLVSSVAAERGLRRTVASLPTWRTVTAAEAVGRGAAAVDVAGLVGGEWQPPEGDRVLEVPCPMTGAPMLRVANPSGEALGAYVESLEACPKAGLHNPLKAPERYVMYGDVCARAAAELRDDDTAMFFARLIQRVAPKSEEQALGEVGITRAFLDTFAGDGVRRLAKGFTAPGDRYGQESVGYRWPFGPVAVITPFNFPLEIPALQSLGALFMGNKPVVKVDARVGVVMEQFVRLLHACGMPRSDMDLLHSEGPAVHDLLVRAQPRSVLFTGSSRVAELLCRDLHGRVKVEDAGFDWKILGPDASADVAEYVAWQCDQDAYACQGQKCSAQSILFVHSNWRSTGLVARLAALASRRSLDDLTMGPTLSWTTGALRDHVDALLAIPGARLAFGGTEIANHTIPACYGALVPTAVFVPLEPLVEDDDAFAIATTEVFGPLQVITEFDDASLPDVLQLLERMDAHLTAAVVSNDAEFTRRVLACTVNGTTYAGLRARTTGAPQNHWFGPAGDPRAAGIGSPEAIQLTWSGHREIVTDDDVPRGWTAPPPT